MARRLASFLLLLAAAAPLPAADFFVSPTGSDNAAGTAAAPFASLTRARDAIRTLKAKSGLPPEGITVWLRGGFHELSASLLLQEADAGTATAPIVYAAYPGEEVRLTGAKRLDPAWFSSVTSAAPVWSRLDPAARGQIVVADLPAHGITNFGALANRDAASRLLPLTLACDGRPLPLARWPNDPQEFALTQTVPALTQITYAGDRPSRWLQAEDPWVHGLWSAYWADFHLAVAAIDPVTRTLTFAQAPASYGILPQRPFYAYNLLEELDQPGEYYLDRTTGRLYLWPTRPLAESTLQASLLEVQLVLVGGAAHVCFRDLVFEGSRTELVKVARGHDIRFERCLFRNGRIGANLAGTRNGLDQCEVVDCHEDGVVLSGGDRATLVPGENYVTNSRIHRVARSSWAYRPCVRLTRGCGQIVAHNLFDDHPHSAILFDGNDHRIEHNEIRRVCRLTADCGAIYTGRDWGYRGNRIAGNFIHHVTSLWSGGAHAVYLDDMVSGPAVEGNVIYRVTDTAIFCGGGRDLVMTNNLIAACGLGHYSGDYCRSRVNNTPKDSTNLLERLAYDGIKYQEDPWRTAYPACAAIPNDFATILTGLWRNPEGCVFDRNAGWDNKLWMREYNSSGTGVFAVYASIAGNDPAIPPLLADAAARDRALRPVSLAPAVPGFNPIAFAAIGRDGSAWPAATRPPPPPALSCRTAAHTVVELEWVDYANLPANQETGSTLERRLLPGGPWRTVRTYGPDTGFDTDRGLLPGRSYAYRLRATNAAGTALSPEVEIALPALFTPTAPPTRLEAEVAYTVVAETTTEGVSQGTVGISNGTIDSERSLRLFDVGDAFSRTFTAPTTGLYRLGFRGRAGGGFFWPNGYTFLLDGQPLALRGDPSSLSAFDASYGGCYWGTMYSEPLQLAAGEHTLVVTAATGYCVADYLEFAPVATPAENTFDHWKGCHFTAAQFHDTALAGPLAAPAGDGVANLLKHAFALDPWSVQPPPAGTLGLADNRLQFEYHRPVGRTGVAYIVEASSDLLTWTESTATVISSDSERETLRALDTGPVGATARFVRVRVVAAP